MNGPFILLLYIHFVNLSEVINIQFLGFSMYRVVSSFSLTSKKILFVQRYKGSEGNRLYSIYIFLKLIYPCFKLPVRLLTLTCKVNIPLSSALVGLKMNPDLPILHCIPLDQWKHELDNISSAATLIPPERNNKRIRSFCFNCY